VRPELPSGTVTFLFTDVEGSTRVLHELGAEGYAEALAEHRRAIREACASQGGVEVDTQGDAFFFAFPTAPGALAAAASFTQALASGAIRVRVGLHTGTPLLTGEGYVGGDVHLAARVAAAGHGGQVLVSQATHSHLGDGVSLASLGAHRLKDVPQPVTLYQLGAGSFPPLKTIANTNLPTPASSFLGREAELYEADLLLQGTRLLTITGPGGAGKTRFALELARRAREERFSDYRDGVFSCFFASLRDPALVLSTIAHTLSVREQPGQSALEALEAHLQKKKTLLLLDNLEHLLEAAPELSQILERAEGLTLLVTSRELLRISGERAYDLPPLPEEEGIALFCERAHTEPSEPVAGLCARLDGLPLAIELAAARLRLLSPEQLLERLSQRLDLLRGGRDADPRQQTLRATIEWSYDLLSEDEQRLFARLSVFAGGCTLEAAQEVADADLDGLGSLRDKSLLRRRSDEAGQPRFWMLETIREYAAERLQASGRREEVRERHVDWTLAVAQRLGADASGGSTQARALDEMDSHVQCVRTALSTLLDKGSHERAARLCLAVTEYWDVRDRWVEADSWYQRVLATHDLEPGLRASALAEQAEFMIYLGDVARATAALHESLALHESVGDGPGPARTLAKLGMAALAYGQLDEAKAHLRRSLELSVATGDRSSERHAAHLLGEVERDLGHYTVAKQLLERSAAISEELGDLAFVCATWHSLGDLELDRRDLGAARAWYQRSMEASRESRSLQQLVMCLGGLACVESLEGREGESRVLWGAVVRYERERAVPLFEDERARYTRILGSIGVETDAPALSLDEAASFALETGELAALRQGEVTGDE
jgi:predicted ATPase/class 3 adenylate cyclase